MTGEAAPPLGNRGFTATAELQRPTATSEGAIFAVGSGHNGIAFYVLGDRLVFDYNLFTAHHKAISDRPVPAGKSTVKVVFEKVGKGGRPPSSSTTSPAAPVTVPTILRMISATGMDAGRDAGSAVGEGYAPPFDFQGKHPPPRVRAARNARHGDEKARASGGGEGADGAAVMSWRLVKNRLLFAGFIRRRRPCAEVPVARVNSIAGRLAFSLASAQWSGKPPRCRRSRRFADMALIPAGVFRYGCDRREGPPVRRRGAVAARRRAGVPHRSLRRHQCALRPLRRCDGLRHGCRARRLVVRVRGTAAG